MVLSGATGGSSARSNTATSLASGGATPSLPGTAGGGGLVGTGGQSASSNGTTNGGRSSTSGGAATGGKSSTSGGAATGGKSSTSGTSALGGNPQLPKFILGADLSSVDEAIDSGSRFADTDGTVKPIFDIVKNHGFNFVRLRTFVNPGEKYGYAYGTGGTCVKTETYCDTNHTVQFAKQVKAAGLGLLLDLHYSDTWADPGNQIIPSAWRDAKSITELASYVRNYTIEVVSALTAAGARPDIVQIGNETTPGMLMHVPSSTTDCWGNNVDPAPIGGSTSNWANLGTLLKAGIEGVKSVDKTIKTMVHLENTKSTSGVVSWIDNARKQGATMDIVGLSCYVAFQGAPSVWQNTFNTLASTFSDLSFVIAEYNPERTQAAEVMRSLPNGRGLGTFIWEPTQSGEWGKALFTWSGSTANANASDFAEFDTIAKTVGIK
jgi:arabinogalactan endo-1,4-beta-galactosidase